MGNTVHRPFQNVRRFWSSRAPIRGSWHFIGESAHHLALYSLYLIRAIQQIWCPIWDHRRHPRKKSAQITNRAQFQTEETPIVLVGCLDVVDLAAPLCLRLQILTPALNPLDGSAIPDCERGSDNLLTDKVCFRAIASAYLGVVDMDVVSINPQKTGEQIARPIDGLRREPGRQHAAVRIKIEQASTGFNRGGRQTLVDQAQVNDMVGLPESSEYIAAAHLRQKSGVGAKLLIEKGSVWRKRGLRVSYRRERIIVYLDQITRIFGTIAIFSQHYRHRIADVARPPYR